MTWTDEDITRPRRKRPRARILVVEDDARFRGILSTRLDRDGYEVFTAADADEARAILRFVVRAGWPTDDLELVILDEHLPNGSGLEVLRELRADHVTTPALLITADPDDELVAEATRCGAHVLRKPFTLDSLCDATHEALCER